jgi:hypothetical protein
MDSGRPYTPCGKTRYLNELKSKKKIIAKDVSEIYHVGFWMKVQSPKVPSATKGHPTGHVMEAYEPLTNT